MLNESERDRFFVDQPSGGAPPSVDDRLYSALHTAVSEVFAIDTESDHAAASANPLLVQRSSVTYTGHLLIDSEQAYTQLDARLAESDHLPIFSIVKGQQTVTVLKGRIVPLAGDWRLNLALFIATIFSLLYVGASNQPGVFNQDGKLNSLGGILYGLPYAIGVIAILGAHELGHYFAARRHRVAVSLPYFIPLPLLRTLGTLGAFIRLREPMRNKKILLDIGVSGPLIGLIVAIPILLYGLKTSPVLPSPILDLFTLKTHVASYVMEGNSLLYALAKIITFGHFLPDGIHDVTINQWAFAGWTGLLITGLNLIPIGQLDGGHALYALFGERARTLFYPILIGFGVLATIYTDWALWVILLITFGRVYATPLDTITPLNRGRRVIAILALIVFVLVFTPIPFQGYTAGG